jgi:hypothetical protein
MQPRIVDASSIMTPSDVEHYLETHIFPVLNGALADLCLLQPSNPFKWLANHLLELAPNESTNDDSILSAPPWAINSPPEADAQLQQQLESCKQQIVQLQQQLESCKQKNGQLQQRVDSDHPSASQFARAISDAGQRRDEAFMCEIFKRHATKEKLSASALIAALKDIAAPVLAAAASEGLSDATDYVFRRANANLSGDVDFAELAIAALASFYLRAHAACTQIPARVANAGRVGDAT